MRWIFGWFVYVFYGNADRGSSELYFCNSFLGGFAHLETWGYFFSATIFNLSLPFGLTSFPVKVVCGVYIRVLLEWHSAGVLYKLGQLSNNPCGKSCQIRWLINYDSFETKADLQAIHFWKPQQVPFCYIFIHSFLSLPLVISNDRKDNSNL